MIFTLINRIGLNLKINFNFLILIFFGVTLSCNSPKNESENSLVKEQSENYLNDSLFNEIKWKLNCRRLKLLIDTSRSYSIGEYPIQTFIAWTAFDYKITTLKILGDTLFLNEKIDLSDSIIINFHIDEFYLNTTYAIDIKNCILYFECDSLNKQTYGFSKYLNPVSIFEMWSLNSEDLCFTRERSSLINDWFKEELNRRFNFDTLHCDGYHYFWEVEIKKGKFSYYKNP